MLNITDENQASWKRLINILTFAIPAAVAILLSPGVPKMPLGDWTKLLPHVNGVINSLTALFLVVGFFAIKKKNIALHRRMMLLSFTLGAVFLVTYILYHGSNPETRYCGAYRGLYFFLLITHILCSLIVIRFVLLAIFHGLRMDIEAHKKVVKWTYPIWLYVSVSGVIVYLLISPCYQ